MTTRKILPLAAVLGLVFGHFGALRATASDVGRSKVVTVQVLVGQASAAPGSVLLLGLHLRMNPGWHTYWENPGDSGLPTTWEVSGPEGTVQHPMRWPIPERLGAGPLMSYGYKGETVLFRQIRLPNDLKPGTKAVFRNNITWLECADVCLPGKATVTLTVPVESAGRPDEQLQQVLLRFEKQVPRPMPPHWKYEPGKDAALGFALRGSGDDLEPHYFFPAPGVRFAFAEKQSFTRKDESLVASIKADPAAGPVSQLKGVMVFKTPTGLVGYALPGAEAAAAYEGLWQALLFAFLGGLILNLMPCVLPVLSIKIQSLLLRSGESRAQSLLHGGMLTAGVLSSFWLMAGVILFARAGGESLGWGFQLQSPPIVAVLTGVMFLFALNLLGVFEVGTSLQGVSSTTPKGGLAGSFLTGVLAVVVAAPCTAPFMGAALGYAIVQPALIALGVFTALGLGLAAPYILLSVFPGLLAFLPKQGPWMDTLKKSMGFLLAAAVAWLVWLLGRLAGVDAIGWMLGALIALAAAAWIYGSWVQPPTSKARLRGIALCVLLLLVGLYLGNLSATAAATQAPMNGNARPTGESGYIQWENFSPAVLSKLRDEGRPVFLDFTADWCLSCKVNERTSLETKAVGRQLRELGFTALRADWTRHDPVITKAIRSYGRSGVPVYVIYPRGRDSAPFLLPEVLTESMVLSALKRGAGE